MAARLKSPSGPVVSVDEAKVDGLLARGFTRLEEPKKKAPAKRSAASKSSK